MCFWATVPSKAVRRVHMHVSRSENDELSTPILLQYISGLLSAMRHSDQVLSWVQVAESCRVEMSDAALDL